MSLIRFPLMTIEQFAVNAVQTGLLTDAEAVKMFLYYVVSFVEKRNEGNYKLF